MFGTTRTITSDVYPEEIRKRCPKVTVVQQICAELAGAIEEEAPGAGARPPRLGGDRGLLAQTGGAPPHRAILGCTHFPLVEHLFRRHLPPFARLLSQPEVVADSFEDYLARHARLRGGIERRLAAAADDRRAAGDERARPRLLAGGRRFRAHSDLISSRNGACRAYI